MASIADLHRAVVDAAADGRAHRLSFYAKGDDGIRIRKGHLMIQPASRSWVDFENLPAPQAVIAITGLELLQVFQLPMVNDAAPARPDYVLDVEDLLRVLDDAVHAPRAALAASPVHQPTSPQPFQSAQVTAVRDAQPPDASRGDALHANDLMRVRLEEKAVAILETYFGNGAAAKVRAIAAVHSPYDSPTGFLRECENLASMIVGAKRSSRDFQELHALFGESP